METSVQTVVLLVLFIASFVGALYVWLRKKYEEDQRYGLYGGEDDPMHVDFGRDEGTAYTTHGEVPVQIPEDVRYASLFRKQGITRLNELARLDALTDVKGIGKERATDFAVDLKNELTGSGMSATFENNILRLPTGHTVAVTERSPEAASA